LYKIVETEYETLYSEAKWRLNWDKFEVVYNEIESDDKRESEKISTFFRACEEIEVMDAAG
jgi:hypothetical protein